MTASSTSFFNRLSLADAFFVLAAGVGVVLYFWLLPSQHPDATADFSLGEAQAIEVSEQFLNDTGRGLDSLVARAELYRDEDLITKLQRDLGRAEAIAVLQQEDANLLSPYYWRVRWAVESQSGGWPGGRSTYEVNLTQAGDVWTFKNNARNDDPRPDRRALAQVLAAEDVETAYTSLRALADSTLDAALRFAATDTLMLEDDRLGLRALLQEEAVSVLMLDSLDAVGLARYHLSETPLGQSDFVLAVDSVRIATTDDAATKVFFQMETPLQGQTVQAAVSVLPIGALVDLVVTFNAEDDTEVGLWSNDFVIPISQAILYFLLLLAFSVLFFRRLLGKTIDINAALFDGVILALVLIMFIIFSKDVVGNDSDASLGEMLLNYLITLPLLGGLTALGVFMVSGATDSIARPLWPEKLSAMALVRQVSFLNQRVGTAFLRGTLIAYASLGLMTMVLVLMPTAIVETGRYDALLEDARSLVVSNFMLAGLISYLVLVLAFLGIGSVIYRRFKSGWVIVPVTAVLITLFQTFPLFLLPNPFTWIHSAVFAVVLALCFWRYDFLTTFIASFFTWALWSVSSGWYAEASPIYLDFMIAHIMAVGALVLGVSGVYSRRTGEEKGKYVPVYVKEMAQQERLKREVEIAREVQESFLPRTMPEVPGLDIAAMCLAAQEVGGDYYDFVEIAPGKLAVVVGDVSGKGTQAAFYMTLVKGMVQTLSREGLSSADVMRRLNMLFCENVTRGTFISMIYGVFDVEARTFTFARAGHNPVILKRSPSQEPDMVQPSGLAIGLVTGTTFDNTIEEKTLQLRLGDVLVFYTDGFSEAMNRAKDQYGDDRLARKVGDLGKRSAIEILHAVAEDVHHFVEAAGRHDDMTMVVVKLTKASTNSVPVAARKQVEAEA